jgi:alanine-glyoxylate transaminase/serine-glyoxylate transaminase/serine-pyruvate transaminase
MRQSCGRIVGNGCALGAGEVGLVALDIEHGKGGVQAAIEWLGRSVTA